MLRVIASLILAFSLHGATAKEPDQSKAAIRAKMLELAGPRAIRCGMIEHGKRLGPAWRCAQDADRAGKPFWLAQGGRRTDSVIWHLMARGPGKKRYVIFYTSNNFGQPTFDPYFSITECNEPFQLFENSLFGLRCGPDVP